MPDKETLERVKEDKREGKSASTQAGEFIREEIHHLREGKHGARSTEQAIAIGLSKARRAGVDLAIPAKGKTSAATREQAKKDRARSKKKPKPKTSPGRSRGALKMLKRESTKPGSKKALAAHAKRVAKTRTKAERSASAKKAARTRARNSAKK
jgi:hypothetical protein